MNPTAIDEAPPSTNTPLTDFESRRFGYPQDMVSVSFARELEKKLNKANANLTILSLFRKDAENSLEKLADHLAEVEEDAARYRFLRRNRPRENSRDTRPGWIHVAQAFDGYGQILTEQQCDEAIDAARYQEER